MPAPERVLTLLRRAIDHVAATPGRTGHLVRLRDGTTDVIVAGDLHGHVPNFQAVLKAADLANHPSRHLVLQEVVHGPFQYPDGSDKSHQLVDLFAALKCQYPGRVHLLPGNHELAEWTGRPIGKGDDLQNDRFREGVTAAYGAASEDVYRAYLDLFRACPLAVRLPNRIWLSHTLPAAKYLPTFDEARLEAETFATEDVTPGGWVFGLLWGRDTSEANVAEYLRKCDADLLVSGHIPTDEGFDVPNGRQLIVDCSATPAAVALVPAGRPITHAELVAGVRVL
jgi:hypothetical protein